MSDQDIKSQDGFYILEEIATRLRTPYYVREDCFRMFGSFREEGHTNCNYVVAIPPANTGLRLFCLLLPNLKTLIFCGGFDKKGHIGSNESSDRLKPIYLKIVEIGAAIASKLEEGDLALDTINGGFYDSRSDNLLTDFDLNAY